MTRQKISLERDVLTRGSNIAEATPGHSAGEPPVCEDVNAPPVAHWSVIFPKEKNEQDSLAAMRHELLSPLTLIKGYTATLLQFNDTITEEQRAQYLRGIDSASNRIIRLIQRMRDIGQLERSEVLKANPVSVLELVRRAVSEAQSGTKNHVIRLHSHGPMPRVKLDSDKIEEVLNNLLDNAIKYSPVSGDIHVELRTIRNGYELQEMFADPPEIAIPSLIITVADDGIGLPEEDLDRVFKKFYRVKNEITRGISGTGLGLYICKAIVEAHGGRIWCRNRYGQGSIFAFTIPLD